MPDPTSKIPPACEDCGGYHTAAEHEAFHRAQKELKGAMSEILTRLGPAFEKAAEVLRSATEDPFEQTVLVASLAHFLMDTEDVPEDTFNRCFDALIDTANENPWIKQCVGKKPASA